MAFKTVSLEEIKKQYNHYIENPVVQESLLDNNWLLLRKFCLEQYFDIKNKATNNNQLNKHQLDASFGMNLYLYLKKNEDFISNPIYESDYEFWRYFAVYVIPDIVADRWNINKSDHFYSKATAIYPFQIYWYINLSWQGNEEATLTILEGNQEDHILQLVDRPSSIGVNLELYRKIMYEISKIPAQERKNKFRAVMINNTSKLVNLRPEIYPGGVDEYVKMIFEIIKA